MHLKEDPWFDNETRISDYILAFQLNHASANHQTNSELITDIKTQRQCEKEVKTQTRASAKIDSEKNKDFEIKLKQSTRPVMGTRQSSQGLSKADVELTRQVQGRGMWYNKDAQSWLLLILLL